MSGKPPAVTPDRMVALLRRRGFVVERQDGSHAVLKHPDGRRATVPMHRGRDLGKGLHDRIISDTGLTTDDVTRG